MAKRGIAQTADLARSGHTLDLVGLAAVSLLFMWPAAWYFRSRPLQGTGDGSFFFWAWWAMPRSLVEGRNPFETSLIFHPVGADLSLSTTAPLLSLLTTPVRAVLGPIAQVNTVQLVAAWAAAAGGYLLVRHVTCHRGVALLGGIAYSFSPFRFMHAPGHLNLINTAPLPVGVLLLLRLLDRPTRGRAAALGGLVGASFLIDPQIAVLTVTCFVPIVLHQWRRVRTCGRHLLGAALLGLVVASPLIVAMAMALRAQEGPSPGDPAVAVSYSSDPTRWVVPPVDHPVLGELAASITEGPRPEGVAYPGLVVVSLAMLGLGSRPLAHRVQWVGMAAIGFVLSLGPYVSHPGGFYQVALPFRVIQEVPLLDVMRVPGRFALVGVLALDVLAMAALAQLAARRAVWALVLGALLVFELLPGHKPVHSITTPAAYEVIRAAPNDAAVLEIPMQWSTGSRVVGDVLAQRDDAVFLAYATSHGHPVVSGVASRYPDRRLDELLSIPVYQQVLALQGEPGFEAEALFDAGDLKALGIGFVVYHRDRPMPQVRRHMEALELPVLADDGTVIVWGVSEPGDDRGSPSAVTSPARGPGNRQHRGADREREPSDQRPLEGRQDERRPVDEW